MFNKLSRTAWGYERFYSLEAYSSIVLACRVSKNNAEIIRALLNEHRILDKNHRIFNSGEFTEIPILNLPDDELAAELEALGGMFIDQRKYAWRETFKDVFKDILAEIDLPDEIKEKLPRRWEKLGHVLILKFGGELDDWQSEIARGYSRVLGTDTVLRDTGGVRGEFREPVMEVILGDDPETVHLENGIKYCLDASRLMFSSGNVDERIRMANICETGETVVDMFAGIGYFTLPMSVHSDPEKVITYDINPLAYEYLLKNVALNNVEDVVEARLGNCQEAEEGVADRVIMGYIGTTHEYLPKAVKILKGKGIIHYHETCPLRLLPSRPLTRVMEAVEEQGLRCRNLDIRTIKSYAPGVQHVVVDADIR